MSDGLCACAMGWPECAAIQEEAYLHVDDRADWINRQLMLEVLLTTKVLPAGGLHPAHDCHIVRKSMQVPEVLQSHLLLVFRLIPLYQ